MDTQQMQDPLAGLFGSSETGEEGSDEDTPFLTSDGNDKHKRENGQFDFKPNHDLTYVEAKGKLKTSEGWHEVSDWSDDNLKAHFGGGGDSDHSAQYPGWNINNYRDWSRLLLKHNPDNHTLFGFENDDVRLRYCPITGDFVKEHKSERIITMFRPNREKEYYDEQVEANT